jgi:hypothetical protein
MYTRRWGAPSGDDARLVVVASINGTSGAFRAPTVHPTAKFCLRLFETCSQKQLFVAGDQRLVHSRPWLWIERADT